LKEIIRFWKVKPRLDAESCMINDRKCKMSWKKNSVQSNLKAGNVEV
jgi:hypothetical protein